jgi:hypothetical protein
MKSFKTVAAQGEITIRRLSGVSKTLPENFKKLEPQGGKYVIGHSETGHHHVIDAADTVVGELDSPPEGMRVLRMILEQPLKLEHLRDFDTHEPLVSDPGIYEVRIAREYDPYAELARKAAD